MAKAIPFPHKAVKIYRKFPNYLMLGFGFFFMIMEVCFIYFSIKKGIHNIIWALIVAGLCALWPLLHQFSNFLKREKPILMIDESGLWYDGIWYKRNSFYPWEDIKKITWNQSSSGLFSVDYITIRSFSYFPFIITSWNLDMSTEEILNHMMRFYSPETKLLEDKKEKSKKTLRDKVITAIVAIGCALIIYLVERAFKNYFL